MRISDWSSDVCSSDLRKTTRLKLGDDLRRHLVIERNARAIATARGATRRLLARAVSPNLQDLSHRCLQALPKNRTRTRRSEEHTSELQSLMRISYAVFCLKKKNTSEYIQPKTH